MEQSWTLEEALAFYPNASFDQTELVALLREVQENYGGFLPAALPAQIAQALGLKESFLLAIVRRIPSLRLEKTRNSLEMCGGNRCAARARLEAFLEQTYGIRRGEEDVSHGFVFCVTGCMRQCGKGPCIKWNGQLYTQADEALLRRLIG